MAEIKIDIKANATNAKSELDKLNATLENNSISLAKARKNLIEEGTAVSGSSKSLAEYTAVLKRHLVSINNTTEGAEQFTKVLKLLRAEEQKLMQGGASGNALALFSQAFDDAEESALKLQKSVKKAENEQKQLNERFKEYKLLMTGSEVDLLENKYSKLEKQLDQLIRKRIQLENGGKSLSGNDKAINSTLGQMNTLKGDIGQMQAIQSFNASAQAIDKQIQYYNLLGNSQAVARKQLEKYDLTLKQTIDLYGKNSTQAQKALSDYKSQKETIEKNEKALKTFMQTYAESKKISDDAYNSFLKIYDQSKAEQSAYEKEQEAKAQQLLNDQIREQMAIITGNEVELYRIQYEKLEKQLKQNIQAQIELQKWGKADEQTLNRLQKESTVLASELNKVKSAMDKASKTGFGTRINNLVKSFVSAQAILWGVQKAFTFVTQTLRDASKAAAEAEETYNLFVTVFDNVQSKAVDTASKIANAFGSANSTIQSGLGTFGDLIIGLGGTEREALKFAETATKLTMDIASFKNIHGDLSTIFQTTASGLAGNLENFRKMGYIITQNEVNANLAKKGLDNLTGASLQLAQMQERLLVLSEKAVNAQGDMIRTLDSTENITRRLSEAWKEYKENLGADINRIFTPLKKWWLSILETQNDVNAVTKELVKNQEDIAQVANFDDNVTEFASLFKDSLKADSVDHAIKLMRAYGASIEDVIANVDELKRVWKEDNQAKNYTKVDVDSFVERLQLEIKTADANKRIKEQEEERLAIMKEQQEVALTLAQELSGLKGISVDVTLASEKSLSATAKKGTYTNNYLATLKGLEVGLVDKVLEDLGGDISKFSSAIEVALGKLTESDMLGNKQTIISDVFEKFFNHFSTDGNIDNDEQTALNKLINVYEDTAKQIEKLAQIEAEATEYKNNLASLQEQGKSLSVENELTKILSTIPEGTYKGINETFATGEFNARQEAGKAIAQVEASNLSDSVKTSRIGEINAELDKILSQLSIQYDLAKAQVDLEEKARLKEEALSNADSVFASVFSQVESLKGQIGLETVSQNTPNGRYKEITAQRDYDFRSAERELEKFSKALKASLDDAIISEEEYAEKLNAQLDIYNELISSTQRVYEIEKGKIDMQLKQSAIGLAGDTGSLATAVMGGTTTEWMIEFAKQLEIVSEVGSLLTDTIFPVLNAFLEPITEILAPLTEGLQGLLVDALQPLFSTVVSLSSSLLSILNPVFDLVNSILEPVTELVEALLDPLAELLFTITSVLRPIIDLLNALAVVALQPLFNMIQLVMPLLLPIINAVSAAFKFLGAGLTYVSAVTKKVAGSIITFFTGMINNVYGVLRSINILGWRPFGGLQNIDDSKYHEWKNTDPMTEMNKYLQQIDETNKQISDSTINIDKNTANDKTELIKQLQDLYKNGLISQEAKDGQIALLTGQKYDQSHLAPNGGLYWQASSHSSYIAKGGVVLNLDVGDKDPREIAKEVAKILGSKEYAVIGGY